MSFLWCSWEIFVVDSFYFFGKNGPMREFVWLSIALWNDASRQAAAKRRSLCVAEISKQDKKVIYSSVFFERERCFPFKRERSINTHVVCKKAVSRREGEGRNSFCFKCAIVLNYTRCATLCATLYMLCSSFFLRLDVATRTTLTGSRRRRRRRLRRRRIPQTPPLLRLLALCALFQTLAWI